MTHLPTQALIFAIRAHDSIQQRRKYTDEPYVVHPIRVATLVATVTSQPEILSAALLHDVLEDVTPKRPSFGPEAIRVAFGEGVLRLVEELTDVFTAEAFPQLNRKERKKREADRLSGISPDAQLIKLADMLDNGGTVVTEAPDFARTYLSEKEHILSLMPRHAQNEALRKKAEALLAEAKRTLKF
jgi:(p)ppGpp synthase/HD superfamily hydrolase